MDVLVPRRMIDSDTPLIAQQIGREKLGRQLIRPRDAQMVQFDSMEMINYSFMQEWPIFRILFSRLRIGRRSDFGSYLHFKGVSGKSLSPFSPR